MATNEDALLDSLIASKTSRRAEDVFGGVSSWFKSTFNSNLPVKNLGASDFERHAGWEHSRSFDVGIHPSSSQGQQLISYLNSQGIPYSAFTGAVSKGGHTVATGPHIHVGPPSHAVGTATAEDDLLDQLVAKKSLPHTRGAYAAQATAARNAPDPLDKLARDIDWHFGYSVLQAMPTLAPEKQREIATLATQFAAADEAKKKSGAVVTRSPAWQLLNQNRVGVREGKEIEVRTTPEVDAAQRAAFSAGANPLLRVPKAVRAVWETLALGGAGIAEAAAGATKLLPTDKAVFSLPGLREIPKALSQSAKSVREMSAEARRAAPLDTFNFKAPILGEVNPIHTAQDVGAGVIEFAPLMLIPELGIEGALAKIGVAAATGGAYSGVQAVGRGEGAKDVAKSTGVGAATFGLLGVPLPGQTLARKAFANLAITGGGGTVINLATGQPLGEAAKQGLVLTLLRAPGLMKELRVREGGKERPAAATDIERIRSVIPGFDAELQLRAAKDAKFKMSPEERDAFVAEHKLTPEQKQLRQAAKEFNERPRGDDVLLDSLVERKALGNRSKATSSPAPETAAENAARIEEAKAGLQQPPPKAPWESQATKAESPSVREGEKPQTAIARSIPAKEQPFEGDVVPNAPDSLNKSIQDLADVLAEAGHKGSDFLLKDYVRSKIGLPTRHGLFSDYDPEKQLQYTLKTPGAMLTKPGHDARLHNALLNFQAEVGRFIGRPALSGAIGEKVEVPAISSDRQIDLDASQSRVHKSVESLVGLIPKGEQEWFRQSLVKYVESQTNPNAKGSIGVFKTAQDMLEWTIRGKRLGDKKNVLQHIPESQQQAFTRKLRDFTDEVNNYRTTYERAAAQPSPQGEVVKPARNPNRVTLPEPPQGTRAFPESAARVGLPQATNLTYAINTDVGAVERSNQRIASKGAEATANEIFRNPEPSKDDVVAGSILAHRLTEQGNISGAIDLIDHLSEKLTKGGQQSQAASLIARLSPEGVLLAGQRRLPAGMKLTEQQGTELIAKAKRTEVAEAKVVELGRQIAELKAGRGPAAKRTTADRIGTLQDRLLTMETAARARLAARVGVNQQGGQAGATTVLPDIADYSIIGASKLARKGITLVQWTDEMVREFGDAIKPHLKEIYRGSYKLHEEQRRLFQQERLERGARKAGATDADLNRVINEQKDAQTEARKSRVELSRTFEDLNKSGGIGRFMRGLGDVASLSRAIETTGDLSWGFRQGKMAFARHPLIWFEGFRKQAVALNEANYERLLSEIELDSDYKYIRRMKVELQGVDSANSERLALRGEEFASHLVRKLPILKQSEMAYNAMGDWVKSRWAKARLESLRRAGVDLEAPESRQLLEFEGELINNATGRGKLPFNLTQASPLINQATYSARFWASRLHMLKRPFDPRMYGVSLGENHPAYPKSVRVETWKTLGAFYGVVGGQLLLLRALGFHVGLNWRDPKTYGRADKGKIHLDLTAGMGKHLRYIAGVTEALVKQKNGEKLPEYQTPLGLTGQYLRTAESPNASIVHDVLLSRQMKIKGKNYGTDYKGDPVFPWGDPRSMGFDRVKSSYWLQKHSPIVLSDVLQAYNELGWKQAATLAPLSITGEGVNVYDKKKKR